MRSMSWDRPGDVGTCERCRTFSNGIRWSEEHGASLCAGCSAHGGEVRRESTAPPPALPLAPPRPLPSEIAVPHSSVLGPSTTEPREGDPDAKPEAEVEQLLRLHAAAGKPEPLPVDLPPLPDWATPAMRDVAQFYVLVRGLRLAAGQEADVPFGLEWVSRKVAWPKASVSRALQQLVAAGVLERTGALHPRKFGRGTALYAPGLLPSPAIGVEGRAELARVAPEPEAHLRDEPLVRRADDVGIRTRVLAAGGGQVDLHAADRTTRRGGRAGRGDHHREGWRDD